MKLKLQNLLFLFLLGAMGVKAQGPVITAAGFNPVVGEFYSRMRVHTNSVNTPDSGGANKVWDYSNLQDSLLVGGSFISPKGFPYSDSFPTANLADTFTSVAGNFVTYFYQISDRSYGFLGSGSKNKRDSSVQFQFSKPISKDLFFPMGYNGIYTDSFKITAGQSRRIISYGIGYDTLYVDSYGTLKLPNATYNNVLRVYHSPSGIGRTYKFYTNGVHFPLLTIYPNLLYYTDTLGFTNTILLSYGAIYYVGTTLPLQISSFTAALQNKIPLLQWSAANTENTKQFNIQRSIDSKNFVTVGQVGINGGSAYHYEDNTAPNGTVYYRLQQLDKNGATFYSNVCQLSINNYQLSIYPNPAKGAIHITFKSVNPAEVMIYDVAGRLVYQNKSYSSANSIATDTWSKGTYNIRLKDNDGWKVSSFEKE